MRIFQNSAMYPAYRSQFDRLAASASSFSARRDIFLADRFAACHFLSPVLSGSPLAFFTNGDDEVLQRLWATEHGLPQRTGLEDILLAQVEEHRTEVFYNMDPMRYGSKFARRLPSCVKKSIAWRAAPSPGADFAGYDLVVCNFPSILASYRARGWRAEYFSPAHDHQMDAYAQNDRRPIDVLFVGGYTRHHRARAVVLEAVARLRGRLNVVLRLDQSRLTRFAESPIGRLLPLSRHRRPPEIRCASAGPVFGRTLYECLSHAKVVLNGAIDMAGPDRGNMRCFEALGCGSALVSDTGNYPQGFVSGGTLLTYGTAQEAVSKIEDLLANAALRRRISDEGHRMIRSMYSKEAQWMRFQQLGA